MRMKTGVSSGIVSERKGTRMKSFAKSALLSALIAIPLSAALAGGDTPYTPNGVAPPQPSGTGNYWCMGIVEVSNQGPANRSYYYFTDAFPAPKAEVPQVIKQWRDYLQSQHDNGAVYQAQCATVLPDPTNQQAKVQMFIDKYKSNATVIRTTWKYGQPASEAKTAVVQEQVKQKAPPSQWKPSAKQAE